MRDELPLGPALLQHVTAPVEGDVDRLDSKLIRIREGLLCEEPILFLHEPLDVLARGRNIDEAPDAENGTLNCVSHGAASFSGEAVRPHLRTR